MKRFYVINELPKNKWLKIICMYEAAMDTGVRYYYCEMDEKPVRSTKQIKKELEKQ